MVISFKDRIINTLVESLNIKKKDINDAIKLQKEKGIDFDKALIEKGLINEEDLLGSLGKELHIPFIRLKKYKISPALKEIIPEHIAKQYKIVPFSKLGETITVAIADPFNILTLDDLKSITGHEIDMVMSTDSDIREAIHRYYGSDLSRSVKDVTRDISLEDFEIIPGAEGTQTMEISADEGEQAPIIRIVNLVIREALKQRASDIHIEPMEDCARVRYRVDGVLRNIMKIPKKNQNAVMVRIQIISQLDITGVNVPQDGRFKMKISDKEVDFRVSLLPTIFGQKIVLRILDKESLKIGLDGLGFSKESVKILRDAVAQPFGLILVTGPTGSGKSTTLYSVINQLNTIDKNIITVEDPVEYLIDGLTQIQVRPDIGLTFASGLKAILRQSPDVVMVGEIRDFETADITIKASLTGQLVFSTLHTNDASGALTRLVDMGVEPFLVASSLVAVCAQRLCRKICSRCKKPVQISAQVLKGLDYKFSPGTVFYEGEGCDACRQTGYSGRLGVTEILQIDDSIREMLITGKSSDEIKEYARQDKGMVLLREDILKKFSKGVTSLEEVLRVTGKE